MLAKEEALKAIAGCGVIAVIRTESSAQAVAVATAIKEGGITPIEITMTVPGALDALKEVGHLLKGTGLPGAGTVLDPETARAAILSGAEFVVSPTLNLEVIKLCQRYDKVVIPGAFTPTEILTAWEAGADIVKVFPATVGGPQYFRDLKGPLPQIKLLPTGGVSLENTAEFIRAGAVAVAVGTALVDRQAVAEQRFEVITERARQFIEAVRQGRQ
ncbi:MAG TPA: bifunctional 4-hydroxy-2-oxoglutarate aldolase/2-dehydro-3-deoxy-phosphogluconate aldolase [Dehalococcoidia bacterium]|jgi:2-dehydro-3-deoxyphosphogluconate aldolase/(4S)-4-hydroxy-2-oxoglutarate aldolase|nr:bifunctional 4-hydroxy-2-oxoglutarate aldolase/2-dehydro-3-deoxy-phosphogluconate aldolase [Dehalococcoidia bacterium]